MAFWSKKPKAEPPKPKQFMDLPPTAEPPAAPPPTQLEQTPPAEAAPAAQAAQAAPAQPTPEQAQSIAELREKAQKIAAFMKTQPQFEQVPEGQGETLVGSAVGRSQFLLAEAANNETGQSQPIGVALWAMVSPEVDQRLGSNLEQPVQLTPADWHSGDIPWIIALVGGEQVVKPILQRLNTNELKGRNIKMRIKDGEAPPRVAVLNAEAAA